MDEGGMARTGILLIVFGTLLALSPMVAQIISTYEFVTYVFYVVVGCGIGLLASTQLFEHGSETVEKSGAPSLEKSEVEESIEEKKEVEKVEQREESKD